MFNCPGHSLYAMLNTLVAIGAAQALYLTLLVWLKPGKKGSDYLLGTYLFALAATFALTFLAFAYALPDLMAHHLNVNLLLAPLFFLYVQAITGAGTKPRRWIHLLPYLLTWLYWLYLFISRSEIELDLLFAEPPGLERPALFFVALMLEALAIPVYVCATLWLLRNHQRRIAQTYSYTEGIDLKWARVLVYCTGALWLGIVAAETWAGNAGWVTTDRNVQIGYAAATFFIFYLGYFGLKQGYIGMPALAPPLPAPPLDTPAPVAKYERSGLKEETSAQYTHALVRYVAEEKPYLQSQLSLQDLADALGIPAHHLSQAINVQLGQSFYEFINRHRVDEFKRRILHPHYQHFTLMAIALDCGFNAKSSFNRIFKKLEHCTPTEFLNRQKKRQDSTSHPAS